jgi:UDPglucose 6-dehydrogenase
MKILIAGYGFVGKAQELVLKGYHDLEIHDPYKGYESEWLNIDAVVISVATPPKQYGECDYSNVIDVLNQTPDVPVLIKSTISVEGWREIKRQFPNKQICFSPEFLRQASWEKDAYFKDMWIGGNCTAFWSDIYLGAMGKINIHIEDPAALVAGKALRNSFLALKVSFFNQIYDYCEDQNLDYESVVNAVASDERIGFSHTGITEQRGFGGHCFPKDTLATVRSAQGSGRRFTLLEEAINYNDTIRKKGTNE